MADDKGAKPAAPAGHDPIVLIIGALLAITLIANLFGGKGKNQEPQKTAPAAPQQQAVVEQQATYEQSCGLFVSSPEPLQKVSGGALLLEGMVGSCEWIPTGSIGLYAQLIDSAGNLVSNYIAVRAEGGPGTPNAPILGTARPFSTHITLTGVPKTKTGFLILVNPDTTRATTKTVRIPVRFQ
ncbi:MAG TPA: hypothetical protein VLB02_01350 [Candidatus Paceibacterota bacterium]|nr:hypothetical protein [Candidatus Paceibacterota bacterium]